MGLIEDIEIYREPLTRMVGLTPLPLAHSSDNGLLFSATYLNLLSLNTTTADWDREIVWFMQLVNSCQIEPGLIARYPGDKGVQAHDDLIGVAALSQAFAKQILAYGQAHGYSWNTAEPGKWTARTFLYRIGGFVPFLKVRSGVKLNLIDKLNVAASFLLNTRENRNETSGRCLLFLMHGAFLDTKGWLVTKAINHWLGRMRSMYGGVDSLYLIYFGPDHPLTKYAPKSF